MVWVVLSEIFPNRIRGRARGLATVCLWGANIVVSQMFPILNENERLVQKFKRGFPSWVYAACCIITVTFGGLALPKTADAGPGSSRVFPARTAGSSTMGGGR